MVDKFFFGDDIFVSYSRADGATYAAGLADELTKKRFSCRLDLWETVPGIELPAPLIRRLRACGMLVVVGTEHAATSPHVGKEIGEFLACHKQPRIIVIEFNGRLDEGCWSESVRGLPREPERSLEALITGIPSSNVVNRIDRSFTFTRRNDRLRRTLFLTSAAILIALLVGYVLLSGLRRQADELSRASLARKLASQADLEGAHAEQVSAGWPETIRTSALLAVEANLRLDSRETSYSLRQALDRLPRSGRLLVHQVDPSVIFFDAGGNHLVLVDSDNKSVLVWRIKDHSPPLRIECDCRNVVFNKDGQYLALIHDDGVVSVWDVDKGVARWSTNYSNISGASGISDQNRLVIAAESAALILDLETGNKIAAIPVENDIGSFAFSRDGKRLAISSHQDVCVWVSDATIRERCFEADGYVDAMEFSPDLTGHLLATMHGGISIWDVARGTKTANLEGQSTEAAGGDHVHFSEDGGRIGAATGGPGDNAENWEIASRNFRPIGDKDVVQGHIQSPMVTWDGRYAGIVRDYGIELWNVATGEKERRVVYRHLAGEVEKIAYSRNGALAVATASEIWVYDTRSGSQTASIERLESGPVSDVSYSQDEKYVAIASGPVVSVWDVLAATEITRLVAPEVVRHIAFSRDSRLVAARIEKDAVRVWEIPSGRLMAESVDTPRNVAVEQIAFSPRGSYVLISDNDGTRMVASRGGAPLERVPAAALQAMFSPDERYIAIGAAKTLTVRDLQSGQEWEAPAGLLCFSGDGKYFFASTPGNDIDERESATGRVVASFQTRLSIGRAALSRDGKYLVGTGGAAVIWDLSTAKELFDLQHQNGVGLVEFDPNGRYVAFASGVGVSGSPAERRDDATVWDLNGRKEVARISHKSKIESMRFSRDGRYFGTASEDGTSALLDLATGREITRFVHDGPVHNIFFSKDAELVATASADLVARVWSTRTAQEIAWLNHRGGIYYGRFSEDNQSITTFSDDQRLSVWPLNSSTLRSLACAGLGGHELSSSEWERYVGSEPYRKTCAAAVSLNSTRKSRWRIF